MNNAKKINVEMTIHGVEKGKEVEQASCLLSQHFRRVFRVSLQGLLNGKNQRLLTKVIIHRKL